MTIRYSLALSINDEIQLVKRLKYEDYYSYAPSVVPTHSDEQIEELQAQLEDLVDAVISRDYLTKDGFIHDLSEKFYKGDINKVLIVRVDDIENAIYTKSGDYSYTIRDWM